MHVDRKTERLTLHIWKGGDSGDLFSYGSVMGWAQWSAGYASVEGGVGEIPSGVY